jgi:hypothetical protein
MGIYAIFNIPRAPRGNSLPSVSHCPMQRKFVVLQTGAMSLLGIVNRGSSKLPLNDLAREFFWFCLEFKIGLTIEWVPREENAIADEISKWLIPDDSSISQGYFAMIDNRWGPHYCDLFSSNENNLC